MGFCRTGDKRTGVLFAVSVIVLMSGRRILSGHLGESPPPDKEVGRFVIRGQFLGRLGPFKGTTTSEVPPDAYD